MKSLIVTGTPMNIPEPILSELHKTVAHRIVSEGQGNFLPKDWIIILANGIEQFFDSIGEAQHFVLLVAVEETQNLILRSKEFRGY